VCTYASIAKFRFVRDSWLTSRTTAWQRTASVSLGHRMVRVGPVTANRLVVLFQLEGGGVVLFYRNTSSSHSPVLLFPLFIVVGIASAGGQSNTQVRLEFDPKPIMQQGTVTFFPSYPDDVATPTPSDKDMLKGYSDDGAFELLVDRQSVSFNQYGNYTFNAFAIPLNKKGKGLNFYVSAHPQGTFGDVEDTVKFHLRHEGSDSSGLIPLPLHTIGSDDLLESVNPSSLAEPIKLSGTVQPVIRLRSTLPGFAVQIKQVEVKADCQDCWEGLDSPADLRPGGAGRILPSKGQETEILLNGAPRTLPSLRTSSSHFKISDPHDKLKLHVTYAPVEGGRVRAQDFVIPVRFSPSLWEVVVALVVGIVVGIAMRKVLGQADAFRRTQIAKVFGAVLVSELVLYISVSADTRPLVLFGVNVDPTQPLTIAAIAILVAGGPTLTTWIRQIIQQLWDLLNGVQARPDHGAHGPD
jgi:hypothetical protein